MIKIKTERLMLEPLGTKHYKTTYKYSTDPENTKMMCYLPCDSGEEVMDYLIKSELQWDKDIPEYLDAAVILEGMHIGAVSIEMLDNNTAGELGWIIDKDYQGSGYAVEAAKAFIDYFRERFGLKCFIAHSDSENYASIKALEKLGMTHKETHGGRKNRNSDEERMECMYEIQF